MQSAIRSGCNEVMVVVDDMDVMALLTYYRDVGGADISSPWQQRGTTSGYVEHIGNILGASVANSMCGVHAFTGCDFTSAFTS